MLRSEVLFFLLVFFAEFLYLFGFGPVEFGLFSF
jgi:hypothetical protein